MSKTNWPSLAPQLSLAARLAGETGRRNLDIWLDQQMDRVKDAAFARQFSDHLSVPGAQQSDFNHRVVHTARGALLGGIRFFGGDVRRPFVEVIAHSFDPGAAGISALKELVRAEWAVFAPGHLRLLLTPQEWQALGASGLRAQPDMGIHVARYADMAAPDGRVALLPFADAQDAIDLVLQRYGDVAAQDPALGRNLSPAGARDMRAWHENGQMRAIMVGSQTVGLLAIAPGSVGWIPGDEINEEVISSAHGGQGFAASAQRLWAAKANAPQRLLIGTIDHLNHASRRTAERVGREAVLQYVFVALADA